METTQRWVSVWGNAVSVAENRPERYAKDITVRYPVNIPFSGEALRLTFDNYCGTEPITLNKITVFYGGEFYPVLAAGAREITIPAGERIVTDPLAIHINEGELIQVSFYLADFTLMRSVVYACGPLSEGLYANGDQTENASIDILTSRRTQLFYFLSNVSVLTDGENRAIVCYGDSITAQDWPDYLALRCFREGYGKTAVIRRATSGSRILRQYECLTYESYGLSGSNRFSHEVPTDGADTVIIQQACACVQTVSGVTGVCAASGLISETGEAGSMTCTPSSAVCTFASSGAPSGSSILMIEASGDDEADVAGFCTQAVRPEVSAQHRVKANNLFFILHPPFPIRRHDPNCRP